MRNRREPGRYSAGDGGGAESKFDHQSDNNPNASLQIGYIRRGRAEGGDACLQEGEAWNE